MPVLDDRDQDALNDERNPGQAHYGHMVGDKNVNKEIAGLEDMLADGSEGTSGDLSSVRLAGDPSGGGKGFYKSDDKDGAATASVEKGAAGNQSRLQTLRQRTGSVRNRLMKNKLLVGAGLGVGSVLVIAVILIFTFMQAYKVPHLMENITEYQFARVFQQAAKQNNRTIGSVISTKVANTQTYQKYQAKYASKADKTKELWSKLDKYRPNKTLRNLNSQGLVFNYDQADNKLVGITINDKTLLTPKQSILKGFIPGYTFTQNRNIAAQFTPELNEALRANDAGLFVRGITGYKLRKKLGISYVAWKAGQYKASKASEAARGVVTDTAAATTTDPPDKAVSSSVNADTDEVEEAHKKGLANPDSIDESIKNGGALPEVQEAMDNAGKGSLGKSIVAFGNPIYGIAAPLCIIYDGSIDRSGSVVNRNIEAQEKAYVHHATVADQTKDGATADMTIVRAYSDSFGSNIQSSPEIVAKNGKIPDTSGIVSPEAGPAGSYTVFNAMFGAAGESAIADSANGLAGETCPVLTNTAIAGGVAVLNGAVVIASLGSAGAAEAAVGQAATKVVTRTAEKAVTRLALSKVKANTGRATKFIAKQTVIAGGIAGTTLLTKYVVANRAAVLNDSATARNEDKQMITGSGANLYAGEFSRQQQRGAPLGKKDVLLANAAALDYIKQNNAKQSIYERYASLSNPDSFLSSMAYTGMGTISGLNPSKLTTKLTGMLNFSNLSSTIGSIINPKVSADAAGMAATYGNIQWGWTEEENNILLKDPSYQLLENQRILTEKFNEEEIEGEYGPCFTEDIGTLLENKDIVLDSEGNVLNQGKCSQKNLGPSNEGVFRWRVAQADSIDLDEKANIDEITDTEETLSGGSEFNMSSFNIYYSSDQAHADYSINQWPQRLQRSVDVIKQNDIEVAGLQEVREDQWQKLPELLGNYGIYPENYKQGGYGSQNPIIWNEDKFELVEGKSIDGPQVTKGGYYPSSNMQVKLRDRATQQEIYVINTHEPVGKGDPIQGRYNSAVKRAAYVKTLSQEGVPIFLTGDFNSKYDAAPGDKQPTVGNDPQKTAYCVLTADGTLHDAWDSKMGNSDTCKPRSSSTVDHIFMSANVEATSYDLSNVPPANGSDVHSTLIVGVSIPGTGATAEGTTGGTDPVPYTNAVYKDDTPDPAIIRAEDGTYHLYATGGGIQHLTSTDMVNWKRASGSTVTGAPAAASSGCMWAPDVAKIGNNYFLTWTGSSGDCSPGDDPPIYYGVSTSAGGPFKYKGVLTMDGYSIDSHIFVESDGKAYLFYGGGIIKAVSLSVNGETLKTSGKPTGTLMLRDLNATVEGVWIEKRDNYYYMYYSYGQWFTKSGAQEYSTRIARSTNLLGPYTPAANDYKPLVTGKTPFRGPGHNSVATDNAGNDWLVYHAWSGGNRVLMIDPITYVNGWPVVRDGHPSSGRQTDGPATGGTGAGGVATVVSNGTQLSGWTWPIAASDYKGIGQCWNAGNSSRGGRHAGQDITAASKTKVYAAHDGKVSSYKFNAYGGNTLIIDTGTGLWYNYQHLESAAVDEGDTVKAGDLVAMSDNTGSSTSGAHLHFGVAIYNGTGSYSDNSQTRNPLIYMPKDRDMSGCSSS